MATAAEVRNFAVSVPAGTTIAAPLITPLAMPARTVTHVRVRVPPGPTGLVGWALGMTGVPVIPTNTGGWIVADDEVLEWDLIDQPDSGAWQLIAYNLGRNAHTLYVTFSLVMVSRQVVQELSAPLDLEG